jgi:hypothetical protein
MLWIEAEIARERIRQHAVTETILIHAAIADAVAGGGHLKRVIEDLSDE